MTRILLTLLTIIWVTTYASSAFAKPEPQDRVATSPRPPWGEFSIVEKKTERQSWFLKSLLWVPNRVTDFWDLFRVDVGVGPSFGAVARVSQYAQFGYRGFSSSSFRVGNFGRHPPYLLEKDSEGGFGPWYKKSRQRPLCPAEIGVGADIGIVGAYGGICLEEVIDFFGGLFFFDPQGDDW